MEIKEATDRRIFERFPARLVLRFRDELTNRWGLVQAQNLSAKGIGMLSNKELSPKTPLELWLPIPEKGETYYTRGEVAWSKPVKPNIYSVGVNLERTDLLGMSQFI
ncbi:MAG: PilZ domain-containing protein [Candidatus Omnitrophota bacterium]